MQTLKSRSTEIPVQERSLPFKHISRVAAGVALILCAYSAYQSYWLLPAWKVFFKDFGVPVSAMTVWFLDHPGVAFAVSLIALGVAVASLFRTKPALVAGACVAIIVSWAVVFVTRLAIDIPWLRLHAMSGGG